MKFAEKLAKMMYGRNGNDQLNVFIILITAIISIVNLFVHHIALSIVAILLIPLYIWRSLSKNIVARRKENAVFMKIWKPISDWFKLDELGEWH